MLRVADESNLPGFEIPQAVGKVVDREIGGGVIERIDGEIAAQGVVVDGAVDVVPEDHAPFAER